jgi:hypothetical protein
LLVSEENVASNSMIFNTKIIDINTGVPHAQVSIEHFVDDYKTIDNFRTILLNPTV